MACILNYPHLNHSESQIRSQRSIFNNVARVDSVEITCSAKHSHFCHPRPTDGLQPRQPSSATLPPRSLARSLRAHIILLLRKVPQAPLHVLRGALARAARPSLRPRSSSAAACRGTCLLPPHRKNACDHRSLLRRPRLLFVPWPAAVRRPRPPQCLPPSLPSRRPACLPYFLPFLIRSIHMWQDVPAEKPLPARTRRRSRRRRAPPPTGPLSPPPPPPPTSSTPPPPSSGLSICSTCHPLLPLRPQQRFPSARRRYVAQPNVVRPVGRSLGQPRERASAPPTQLTC